MGKYKFKNNQYGYTFSINFLKITFINVLKKKQS